MTNNGAGMVKAEAPVSAGTWGDLQQRRSANIIRRVSFVIRQAIPPLALLFGWRVIALLVAIIASQLSGRGPASGLREMLVHSLDRWDAGWYLGIAREGYSVDVDAPGQANIAFYPLLPLLMKVVHFALPTWRL